MPFREKLKKAFKSSSPSSSKHSSPTIAQEQRWPSNVYRPDEPMPRPKYRAPVKKEHKEKLESFNFGSSWKRRSHVSLYSPMGSRLPSRRNSRVSRKSVSGPSGAGAGRDSMEARRKSVVSPTRNGSIGGQERRFRHSARIAQQMKLQPEPEHSGDDDVANGMLTTVAVFVPSRTAQLVYHASTRTKNHRKSMLTSPPRPEAQQPPPTTTTAPTSTAPACLTSQTPLPPMDISQLKINTSGLDRNTRRLPRPRQTPVRPVSTSYLT
ncbi:hypothetical protein BDZ85DRAFT_130701 [Elsinoe ampelina]|uniref:Uncharacterized protein n=1 Tax=Elsinoe ampelina TaxID=302913 RepID=A0A6A6GA97_9PEZI|nr:hypothetical protein BDZ85DRAFT_130701 [Elsinoe ampelina]